MRRRDLIKSVGLGFVSWPLIARAQQAQSRRRRLGVLLIGTPVSRNRPRDKEQRTFDPCSYVNALSRPQQL